MPGMRIAQDRGHIPHGKGVWGRYPGARGEPGGMKRDLADILLLNSVGSVRSDRESCSGCRRTPLPGERIHRMNDGKVLCPLCFAHVPEGKRADARPEKVHVGSTRLSVGPVAAWRGAA